MRRRVLAALVFLAMSSGCGPRPVSPFEQPSELVSFALVGTSGAIGRGSFRLADSTTIHRGIPWFPHLTFHYRSAKTRLHPSLRTSLQAWQLAGQPATNALVIVGLRDPFRLGRLPVEGFAPPADSATRAKSLSDTQLELDSLRTERDALYAAQTAYLQSHFGAVVQRNYLCTQAVLAEVPFRFLEKLANWNQVISVIPAVSDDEPPTLPVPPTGKSVAEAAKALALDVYLQAGLLDGGVQLFDTGVDVQHDFFTGVSRSATAAAGTSALLPRDCVRNALCNGNSPGDAEMGGHGTTTAAILIADGPVVTDPYRGVSHVHLEAFRVYRLEPAITSNYAVPDNDAFLAAVDVILPRPGSVVGIEVAVKGSPDDPLSKAANNLQGAGSVVVAAIGNHGRRSDTDVAWDKAQGPRSPGVARGVLGIGARPLGAITVAADPMQSHGIVQHRFKPDIQLPTGTISAASGPGSNTRELPATSGATPYAAAVASAMRSWLSPPGERVDPGQVYACLVACGEMARVDSFPVIRGAGLVRLPVGGQGWWGDVDLGTNGHSAIPIMVNDPTVRRVSVGLWWLDGGPLELPLGFAVDRHRDFDLHVKGPLAGQRKRSAGVDGVFERVDFTSTTSMTGRWIVHIKGGRVGLGKHTVYWAAFATP